MMLERFFHRRIRLTYGLTVCNEATELERLILFLLLYKDQHDEIVVVCDDTRPSEAVAAVLAAYQDRLTSQHTKLNGNFASFKNQLIDMASGDYLFQLDADELPGQQLIGTIKETLLDYRITDSFAVPRVNYVDGLTTAQAEQWNWQLAPDGRVNFPDYQLRLFRLGRNIRWRNQVHEQLAGQQTCHFLPADRDDLCLMHRKTLSRQIQQNNLYDSLQS